MSLVALFFSLGGAGMAATGYRIASIWQISPKVRHALRGARGPAGQPGPQGSQGVQGAPGFPGAPGSATLSGEYQRQATSPITATSDPSYPGGYTGGNAAVACDGFDYAISGGFWANNAVVYQSSPYQIGVAGEQHIWEARGYPADPKQPASVTAYVVCVPAGG